VAANPPTGGAAIDPDPLGINGVTEVGVPDVPEAGWLDDPLPEQPATVTAATTRATSQVSGENRNRPSTKRPSQENRALPNFPTFLAGPAGAASPFALEPVRVS
jgi:hypothetical protein